MSTNPGVEPNPNAASILLVDDTPANLFALSAVLKPLGARIVEAKSGPEAIEQVARESFACALLDVQMPGMDGFEAAEKIRTLDSGRELPIIFLTAIHRDEGFVKKGYGAGAADYITKPFDADVVRARVRAFVKLYEQREETRRAQVAIRTQERDEAVRRLVAFERIATAALKSAELAPFLTELLDIFTSASQQTVSGTISLRDGDEMRVLARVGTDEGELAHEVPLVHDGEVLGVARIGYTKANPLTESDKRLFTAMVDRAAWAVSEQVKRARLHEILASAPAMIGIVKQGHELDFRNEAFDAFFGAKAPLDPALAELADADRAALETAGAAPPAPPAPEARP